MCLTLTLISPFFPSTQHTNDAISVRKQRGITRDTDFEEADYKRTEYFRTSKDPGYLSKFGDGDGSYFDNYLTNSRFHSFPNSHEVGGSSSSFKYLREDVKQTKSHQVPHVGLKQWAMPQAELSILEERRLNSIKPKLDD